MSATGRHPSLAHLYGRLPAADFLAQCPVSRAYFHKVLAAAERGRFAVFGYGSLMWEPGFAPAFAHPALLYGYSRRPCIKSTVYRGTPRRPGLVFGLDAGGCCRGLVLGLPAAGRRQIIRRLFVREMFQGVYRPVITRAHCIGRPAVRCLTFVADRSSPAYAGGLGIGRVRQMVLAAAGSRGSCLDYWRQTAVRLGESGIRWDPGFDLAATVPGRRS